MFQSNSIWTLFKTQELSAEDRSAYILMQRIMPGLQASVMTRQGQLQVQPGLIPMSEHPKEWFNFHMSYVEGSRLDVDPYWNEDVAGNQHPWW